MSTASEVTIKALEYVVETLPVGANLALLHLAWALLSGAFLGTCRLSRHCGTRQTGCQPIMTGSRLSMIIVLDTGHNSLAPVY